MSLKEQITEDMKAAMRAKEADRLLTIRGLMAAMKQKEVDERITLDDAQVLAVIDKMVHGAGIAFRWWCAGRAGWRRGQRASGSFR